MFAAYFHIDASADLSCGYLRAEPNIFYSKKMLDSPSTGLNKSTEPYNFRPRQLFLTDSDSEVEQPKRKKQRIDQVMDVTFRALKLHLSKCPEWRDWRRTQSSEDLFNVFRIGVAVKESMTMQIIDGKQNFDQVLRQVDSKRQELGRKMDNLIKVVQDCT